MAAGGESHEVDARPSDALNLAVRMGAPVFVAADVLDKAGVRDGPFASRQSDGRADAPGAEARGGWRSLSPELMSSLRPREARVGWERVSRQARQALTLAREEAQAAGHEAVGPTHILLGLLREEQGVAAGVLRSLDVTAERVRGQLDHAGSSVRGTATGLGPYAPDAQRVFVLALEEEATRRPNQVGTEHLLLGLLRENEEALLDLGIEGHRVREELHRAMGTGP